MLVLIKFVVFLIVKLTVKGGVCIVSFAWRFLKYYMTYITY